MLFGVSLCCLVWQPGMVCAAACESVCIALLQSWSAAGTLVDIPVAVQMSVSNNTSNGRLPIRLSAAVGAWDAVRVATPCLHTAL